LVLGWRARWALCFRIRPMPGGDSAAAVLLAPSWQEMERELWTGASMPPPWRFIRGKGIPPRGLLRRLGGIRDPLIGGELDIVEFAIDPLHLADIDVLDDLACVGIDRNGTARARPGQ